MMIFWRTGVMILAFLAGMLCPAAAAWAWMIRSLIGVMMFLVLVNLKLSFPRGHGKYYLALLAANIAVGVAAGMLGKRFFGQDIGMALFFVGITPTATAAPVIAALLDERVDFVLGAFLVTNLGMLLVYPVLIPLMAGDFDRRAVLTVAEGQAMVIFLPFLAALAVRWLSRGREWFPKVCRDGAFVLWALAIFLIVANAVNFLSSGDGGKLPGGGVLTIALGSLVICVLNFTLGQLLGGRKFRRETGQALGQKNTTLTVYLALIASGPAAALGPAFYVLWHNLWNTVQVYRHTLLERREKGKC